MVRITIDLRGINATLERAKRIVSDFRGLWTPLLNSVLIPAIRRIFETNNFGRWQRRRDSLPHPLLRKSRRLYQSYTQIGHADNVNIQTNNTLQFGSSVPYSEFHETGTRRIPARPVIAPLNSRETQEQITRYIDDYVDRKLRRL